MQANRKLKAKQNGTGRTSPLKWLHSFLPSSFLGLSFQEGSPGKVDVEVDVAEKKGMPQYSFFPSMFDVFLNIILLLGALAALYGIYLLYRQAKSWIVTRRTNVSISLLYPNPPTVGQTICLRIRFKNQQGKYLSSPSPLFQELKADPYVIQIKVEHDDLSKPVAVVQEVYPNQVIGKFSLRKSGKYKISVTYNGFFSFGSEEGSYSFDAHPGAPSLKHMDFGTHNPQIMCLPAGHEQFIKISAKDEYENPCRVEDIDLSKFEFQMFHLGHSLSVEHEFCHHQASPPLHKSCHLGPIQACLQLKVEEPGIYPCTLTYDNFPVGGLYRGTQKLIVCVRRDEENKLKSILTQKYLPGNLMYKAVCRVASIGGTFEDSYVGVTTKSLVFASWTLALHVYPTSWFPINGKTIVTFCESLEVDDETSTVHFYIQNGLRPSIKLEISADAARTFLVTFASNQGDVLPRLHLSFKEKKATLQNDLSSIFYYLWYFSGYPIDVQHGGIVKSSLCQVPRDNSADWLLGFDVKCYSCDRDPYILPAQEWINSLIQELYRSMGMFEKRGDSTLLHPVSSRVSGQEASVYRLAGQILAKAIVEVLLRGICTKLSDLRLTRTLLASILGTPIHYKFLEADEPCYFRQVIKPLLETDVDEKGYTFIAPPFSPLVVDPNSNVDFQNDIKNLLPDGSNIPVTNENKEHYLSLLTSHRLLESLADEVTAFRDGFHDVIHYEKLSDFGEEDLQLLISGGYNFSVDNLKQCHRVVKEVDSVYYYNQIRKQSDSREMDIKKTLDWFWHVLDNLSPKEQSYFIFFATGSFSLPSCGMEDLKPIFTISLTGTHNSPPQAHPVRNEIILGPHSCFDSFEKEFLDAIVPASERIVLPTKPQSITISGCDLRGAMICAIQSLDSIPEEDLVENNAPDADGDHSRSNDPFINWLRELIHM